MPRRARRKQRPSPASSSLTSLRFIEQLKETGKQTHLKAANTRKLYAGHVKRGRQWLSEFLEKENSPKSDTMVDDQPELSWMTPECVTGEDDPYSDPAFARAFDGTPNKFSDKALALFLTYKGFYQNLGRNTVEGIRVAFKDMWDGRYTPVVYNWQQ